ncbi:MAG: hypothetical protein HY835_01265 [Anaerolineae bacterium]|nr:hypothetical protein [Anaerolineae bacterium]
MPGVIGQPIAFTGRWTKWARLCLVNVGGTAGCSRPMLGRGVLFKPRSGAVDGWMGESPAVQAG